jgi:hypothetical protein
MDYATLISVLPYFTIWIAPLLALGLAIFLILLAFAWFHETQDVKQVK